MNINVRIPRMLIKERILYASLAAWRLYLHCPLIEIYYSKRTHALLSIHHINTVCQVIYLKGKNVKNS